MRTLGWLVLLLLLLDELVAVGLFGLWGWQAVDEWPRWVLVWLLPLAVAVGWGLVASPKAPRRGPVVTPAAKVLVFGLASLALWHLGHPGWAVAFALASAVVNALAAAPGIRTLAAPVAAPQRRSSL